MKNKIQNKNELDSFICHQWNEINTYLNNLKKDLPIPFYSSVDIRESRNKYAPVDHNMYPAGFNNVCAIDLKAAVPIIQKTILKINPQTKLVGIIPESNTKNTFYLDHLHALTQLLKSAGFSVAIISFDHTLFEEGKKILKLLSYSSHEIEFHLAELLDDPKGNKNSKIISFNNTIVDTIVMNHDQSNPLPVDWNIIQTPISPSPKIGWFIR